VKGAALPAASLFSRTNRCQKRSKRVQQIFTEVSTRHGLTQGLRDHLQGITRMNPAQRDII
jgi:hypothetical protein